MDLETLNISEDDNESDTSDEDLDDDEINTCMIWNGIENKSLDIYHKWNRNTCFPLQEDKNTEECIRKPLRFMLLDSDFSIITTKKKIDPCILSILPENLKNRPVQSYNRLYGVTEAGNSVLVNVFGFVPYFYALPSANTKVFTKDVIKQLYESLNLEVKKHIQNKLKTISFYDIVENSTPILNIELVNISDCNIYDLFESSFYKYGEDESSEMSDERCESPLQSSNGNGHGVSISTSSSSVLPVTIIEHEIGGNEESTAKVNAKLKNGRSLKKKQTQILKISCSLPKFVWSAAKILGTKNIITSPIWKGKPCQYQIFEGSINHNIRFLTDLNLSGCTWLEIPAGNHFRRKQDSKLSHCQIEVDCYYKNLKTISNEDDLFTQIPPLRIMSFDIECMVRPPKYNCPRGGSDLVLQIGVILATFYNEDSTLQNKIDNNGHHHDNTLVEKIIFVLGTCDELDNTTVYSFDNEAEMLEAWRLFVIGTDPDFIMGYNIKRFDLPFLLDRSSVIMADRLPYIGRIKLSETISRPIKNPHKKPYKYDEKVVNISGRIIFDMMILIVRNNTKNSPNFKLVDVSKCYLKSQETKEDVSYKDIFKLQNLSSKSRKTLASYCVQDAKLPYLIMLEHNPNPAKNSKWNTLEYYIDKARISGVPLKYLMTKSLEYCTYYKIVRKHKNPLVKFVPNSPRKGIKGKALTASLALKRRNSAPASFTTANKKQDFDKEKVKEQLNSTQIDQNMASPSAPTTYKKLCVRKEIPIL